MCIMLVALALLASLGCMVNAEVDPKITSRIYFIMSIGNEVQKQPIVLGLFGDVTPKTVKNFETLATVGYKGLKYKGSTMFRVIKDFVIQGGDMIYENGTGTTSIYGGKEFPDENFKLNYTSAGVLGMANDGPNTNECQFFITLQPTPDLNGKYVVFGKVISGMETVNKISLLKTDANDKPLTKVVIVGSGKIY